MDGKRYQVGNYDGNWHHQAGKVDLAKEMSVLNEGLRGSIQAVGEVMPEHGTGEIEEHLGEAIGGEPGDVTKHNSKDQRVHDWLDDEPQGTENRLLVTRYEVTPDKEGYEVAVAPDIPQLQVVPLFAGGDDEVPGFSFWFVHRVESSLSLITFGNGFQMIVTRSAAVNPVFRIVVQIGIPVGIHKHWGLRVLGAFCCKRA